MADLKVRMGIRYESRYAVFAARLARKQEKVLRQSGAYAMKVIRNSIIEKKKAKANKKRSTSRPGLPPISHKSGHGGLRYVLFDADMTRQSVMAGVARTPAKNSWVMGSGGNAVRYTVRSSKRAPKLLNDYQAVAAVGHDEDSQRVLPSVPDHCVPSHVSENRRTVRQEGRNDSALALERI
jgi:hypothetical protein